ncbi:hypothetical protein BcDW1_6224 [Botrytis cinerea BcDW1]|uniref:Uncharacterized protein n=2 Tax=Botryotinia fuckeliana TaxID=40559 RepID=G2YV73_BOTF4|nr:hypothetical protein BcDW1_6224 [Botrytis cinerea BcDW1]CCD55521.1 hypothetical protein BofuT4_P155120.1 [Botrytis cinerea T4]
MSASTTASAVSSVPIISSSSVPVISSSSTTTSTVFSTPTIPSSSITVISSPPSSISIISSSSNPTPSSSPSPSLSQTSISSSSTTPIPPAHHTASQTLSPSHISADPSSLLQSATPISIPPPTSTSISLLTQLQDALDFTSTLLGLFFVSLLSLLLIYWSTLYILRKTVGITPRDTSPLNQLQLQTQTKAKPPTKPSNPQPQVPLPPKKEVGFAPHPSDAEFVLSGQKAKEIKRRLSAIPQSPTSPLSTSSPYTLFPDPQPWPKDGVNFVDLTSAPESEKEKVEPRAPATDLEGLSETAGKKKENELTETDLEFQRGVRDVSGDTDAIERRGGRSYGTL